ncbi:extracellular solute-binding protein [Psychrosphaera sp. B3R10]|uniref:sugar ABC transporter substrate-binding protein n=1 Tax=unclassified Psychrosphaera TaxID=2641570 RepID=UPI001C09957C|nr:MULTISPECIES: extracellular solute-binding protein [unclassified Psychrosphaera]MBU2882628.1 extracellular solute-binding protein [Psychrosphaera sp. I2R16]MBU2989353.1 extracellular solute-binding protein [Psychrosphaera sp. B3R10]
MNKSRCLGFILLLTSHFTLYSEELTVAFTQETYDLTSMFNRFSKQTGTQIRIATLGSEDLKVELLQRAGENMLPDAIVVPADYIGLEEIKYSPIPASLNHPDTNKSLINGLRLDGRQVAIPIIAGNHLVLYFNKTHIADPAKEWRELIEQRSILTTGTSLIGWSYNEMYWFLPFLTAFGEPPLVNQKIQLNTQGMKNALSYYWSFSQQNVVDEKCDYQCTFDRFSDGNMAYMINGVWASGKLIKNMGDNVGIAELPHIENKIMRPYYSAYVIAFPNNSLSSNKAAILKKLAMFFQSHETQTLLWSEIHALPVNQVVSKEIYNNANSNEKAIFKQLEHAIPLPTTREMAIAWAAMGKGIGRYRAGILDLEQVSDYMQHVADKSLKELDEN